MKTSPLKLALILIALCGAAASYGDSFLNTLAWTRYLPTSQGKIGADELGNTYLVYEVPNTVETTKTDLHFVRFDISGNAAALSTPFTFTDIPFTLVSVQASPLINGKRFVYALYEMEGMTSDYPLLVKMDDSGKLIWTESLPGQTGQEYFPLNGFADSTGKYYLATNIEELVVIFIFSTFDTVVYDADGNVLSNTLDNNQAGTTAEMFQGKWVVTGTGATENQAIPRWCIVDPTTAVESGFAEYPEADNDVNRYDYTLKTCTDSAGFVYVATTITEKSDSTLQILLVDHFVRKYRPNGNLVWTSKSLIGGIDTVSSASSGGSVWVLAMNGNNRTVEQFDPNGNLITHTQNIMPLGTSMMLADPTGSYLLYDDAASPKRLIADRLGNAGDLLWTLSTTTTAGPAMEMSQYVNAFTVNGNLYTAGMLPQTTQIAVQRYVKGSTISTLTGGSAKAGLTFSLKVSLNAPAPAGGLLVKLTDNNAKLLFPNNTTAYSVAIPAGSIYTLVPMHAGTVATSTAVTVTGNQNGVVRSAVVTVVPST
jgi:hypothetical protein